MRACFLEQNICALGYGVATVQTQPAMQPLAETPAPASAGPLPYIAETTNRMVAALTEMASEPGKSIPL